MIMHHLLALTLEQFHLKRTSGPCDGRVLQGEVFDEEQIWKMRVTELEGLNMKDKIIYVDLLYLMRK